MARLGLAQCLCVTAALVVLAARPSLAQTDPCANIPHADHPRATLNNGKMKAVVFLPDKDNPYYRATRFDWSGIVACVAVNGQNSSASGLRTTR